MASHDNNNNNQVSYSIDIIESIGCSYKNNCMTYNVVHKINNYHILYYFHSLNLILVLPDPCYHHLH